MNIGVNARIGPAGRAAVLAAGIPICAAATLALLYAVGITPSADAAGPQVGPRAELVGSQAELLITMPLEPSMGSTLFTLPWGDGPGQVGLTQRAEEQSRGPEAFALAPDGRVAVLDSVNSRLLLLAPSGASLATAPVALAAPRFLAANAEEVFVLDADEDLVLLTYSWEGTLLQTLPVGPFEEPVTSLLLDPQGRPLIETGHEAAAAAEAWALRCPAPTGVRGEMHGRPVQAAPGRSVSTRMARGGAPRVEETGPDGSSARGWDIALGRGARIDHVVSLDTDAQGRILLGLRVLPGRIANGVVRRGSGGAADPATGAAAGSGVGSGAEVAAPGGVGSDAEVADGSEPSLLLVARIGEPVQTISLVDDSAVYLGVPYVVGLDSAVYQPVATDEGYRLVRHTFPETPGFSEGER